MSDKDERSKNESANEVEEGVGLDELKQREEEQMGTHPPLMMILCRRAKAQWSVSFLDRITGPRRIRTTMAPDCAGVKGVRAGG